MKRILSLLTVVLFAAALTACGGPQAEEGVVINKGHRDAYTTYTPVCTAYYPTTRGPNGITTGGGCMIYTQVPNHHPERWWLTIQDCRPETEGVDEEKVEPEHIWALQRIDGCIDGEIRVGENWDGWSIGDWYGENEPDKPCELEQESC